MSSCDGVMGYRSEREKDRASLKSRENHLSLVLFDVSRSCIIVFLYLKYLNNHLLCSSSLFSSSTLIHLVIGLTTVGATR